MIKGCKICGVSDLDTLNYIVNHPHPPNFIGFICNYPKSPRFVDFKNLKKLLKINKNKIKFVRENTSFENLKELEKKERDKKIKGFFFNPSKPKKKNNFMNKGVVGNYKSFLNISQQTKIKSSFKKEFEKYNFLNNTFMT